MDTATELGPETYSRWRASELGAVTERLEDRLLLDLIGDPRGRDVLDVGCGDGTLAVSLADRGARVIGELGRWSPWAVQRYVRGWFGSSLWRRAHFWTASELRSLAEHAGLEATDMRGAIYYPRSRLAARLVRRFAERLGRLTTVGAAFLSLSATKPNARDPGGRA